MTNPTSLRARARLWHAAMHGDLPALEQALAQGANPDEPPILLSPEGTEIAPSFGVWGAPFLAAAHLGRHQTLRKLLSMGADPSKINPDGSGLMLCATRSGSADCFELALRSDPNPTAFDKWGVDALMSAAKAGAPKLVARLLARGLDPKRRCELGRTALHYACESASTPCCALLLHAGADASAADADKGWTPLFYASSRANPEIVPLLLAHGASIDHTDKAGSSALHLLMRKKNTRPSHHLLKLGSSVHARDSNGLTPLGVACMHGWAHHILDLVQAGADASNPGPTGVSGFHLILENAPFGVAREAGLALLSCGASPDARNRDGFSTLDKAIVRSVGCVEIALVWGTDPNCPHPSTGLNPLDSVVFRSGTPRALDSLMVQALLGAGAVPSPLLMAAYSQRDPDTPEPATPDALSTVWALCRVEHERRALQMETAAAPASSRKQAL